MCFLVLLVPFLLPFPVTRPGARALLWLRHGALVADGGVEPSLQGQDGVLVLLFAGGPALAARTTLKNRDRS